MNLDKPIIQVRHSDLKRCSPDSDYKSECPVCGDGVLPVQRDRHSPYNLRRSDHCFGCGQRFYYLDREIAGETLPVVH